ncbi:unnamed protein product [Prorocentrum cordatum]|uniref:Uncharacterized protein n=1 Tax=Prorocentrum cordatum TaxID=2364126 RepID=A0ABN9SFE6_9DINO|nr:unnamed protein product [Polarella glacialis]
MPLRLPRRCTWRQEDSRCKDMGVEISAAPGRWLPKHRTPGPRPRTLPIQSPRRTSLGSGAEATLIWEERAGAEREEQREEEHEQVPSSTAPAEVTNYPRAVLCGPALAWRADRAQARQVVPTGTRQTSRRGADTLAVLIW